MNTERKIKILIPDQAVWDAAKQDYTGLTREITLAALRAEWDDDAAKAKAVHRANVEKLARERGQQ